MTEAAIARRTYLLCRRALIKSRRITARQAMLNLLCSGATARIDAANEQQDLVNQQLDYLRGPGHG